MAARGGAHGIRRPLLSLDPGCEEWASRRCGTAASPASTVRRAAWQGLTSAPPAATCGSRPRGGGLAWRSARDRVGDTAVLIGSGRPKIVLLRPRARAGRAVSQVSGPQPQGGRRVSLPTLPARGVESSPAVGGQTSFPCVWSGVLLCFVCLVAAPCCALRVLILWATHVAGGTQAGGALFVLNKTGDQTRCAPMWVRVGLGDSTHSACVTFFGAARRPFGGRDAINPGGLCVKERDVVCGFW